MKKLTLKDILNETTTTSDTSSTDYKKMSGDELSKRKTFKVPDGLSYDDAIKYYQRCVAGTDQETKMKNMKIVYDKKNWTLIFS